MTLCRTAVAVVLVGGLLLGVVGLSGCPRTPEPETRVLRIGVISPETGASALLGQAQRRGVEMALEEISAANAAGGWRLEAHFADDEGSPTKAASVAKMLIEGQRVNVILGAIHSSCTLAVMVHTERAGIPQITAGSTGARITEQGNKWIFRTAVNDKLQAEALVEYAIKTLGIKKASILTAADDYGQSGERLLTAAAAQAGLELVVRATYNAGDKDFRPQLLSMKEQNTEGIFVWGLHTEAALIANQAKMLGIDVQLFGASGMAATRLIELGGDAVEGMLITQSFLPDSPDARVRDFVAKYRQRYNENPIPHAAQAYDAVYILADAVKRANSVAPSALREAISQTTGLQLVTESPKFIENGDDVGKRVLITKIQDGKFVLVEAITPGS